ncbi:MAG: gamma-glutamyltransferase family protein [Acidobacteria bacterium]|nr:gamma-glutamyltransferase family protein [Acidobacteriota bacterium]
MQWTRRAFLPVLPTAFLHAQNSAGLVAAANPLAIEAGEAALRQGANALEAAVVTSAVLSVVEPYASGVGGGGFFLIESPYAEVALVIDSRVIAPAAASARMFRGLDPEEVESSALATGIPGTPLCWRRAIDISREHLRGRMTLDEALQPAVRLARQGFPISDTFIDTVQRHRERLAKNAEARRLFLDPNYREGDIATNPDLANTLDSLESTFYRGRMAAAIVESVLETGGRIALEDLRFYDVRYRVALQGSYRGYRVNTAPAPASGYVLLQLLNLYEGFTIGNPGLRVNDTDTFHLALECMKLAYADKAPFLADPEAVPVPESTLASKDYASARRAAISLESVLPQGTARGNPLSDSQRSTTHLCVIDPAGWRVSYTSTLTSLFGAAIVPPGTGFLLNNSLTAFNAAGTGPNAPAAFKRPASAICPFTVSHPDGRPLLIGGAAGGNRIPAILFRILSAVIDHRLNAQDAVSAPRIVNENRITGAGVSDARIEPAPYAIPDALVSDLRRRGHTVLRNTSAFGAAQCIGVDPRTGLLQRAIDPRRNADL